MNTRIAWMVIVFVHAIGTSIAQTDTTNTRETLQAIRDLRDSLNTIQLRLGELERDLTFTGTNILDREVADSNRGVLTLHGYISAYYALYTDSIATGQYQQFPTQAPISNSIGIDIAQIGVRYSSERSSANLTLHTGDIPASSWSPTFNLIQEANVGLRIIRRLWFDIGFFRTHIGIESIQPRENITSSIAVTTYYEPYFMSGAKLTYEATEKLFLQVNAFNSFNSFVETNDRKAVGLSMLYKSDDKVSLTVNSILNDNHPLDSNQTLTRIYNNAYLSWRKNKFLAGLEANLGFEEPSKFSNRKSWTSMWSAIVSVKYNFAKRAACYGRFDYFSDPHEILTGPVYNDFHQLIGLRIASYTLGAEWKPTAESYLRLEARYMQTASHQEVFYLQNTPSRNRIETGISIGQWF